MKTYIWLTNGENKLWSDPKRYLWALGLTIPLFPIVAALLAEFAGLRVAWWTGPIWIAIVVPTLDAVLGADPTNPPDAIQPQLDADRYYRWCAVLFVPLQWASLVFACWLVATRPQMPWIDWLGFTLTVGTVGGVGINAAHELGHKKPQWQRWLSKLALAQTAYGHFFVEHNCGHHYRVATPEDPASARLGESFWAFLPRTLWGSLASAWHLEAKRLERHRRKPWSLHSELVQAWALTIGLWSALVLAFGPTVLALLVLQAVVGFGLLEVVNYLEHYGLLRARRADGRYEICQPHHSWNSNQIASNLLLYNLQRHSDHHAWPARSFQALRHFEQAPQLPTGYAGMLMLALVPPFWRAVMDPRVVRHYQGDVGRANVHPPARQRIVATWATFACTGADGLIGVAAVDTSPAKACTL